MAQLAKYIQEIQALAQKDISRMMGKSAQNGWWQRPIQLSPGCLLCQAIKQFKLPIVAWATIGFIATFFAAGVLRQKASTLQMESFALECNLRAQVRNSDSWASAYSGEKPDHPGFLVQLEASLSFEACLYIG